jgi:hypothetical protein
VNDEVQDKPAMILETFEDYIRPRKNKSRKTQGETFDNFVKNLRLLIMDCDNKPKKKPKTKPGRHFGGCDHRGSEAHQSTGESPRPR